MKRRRENRAVAAAMAAASGVGFSSGRAMVLFFSQTGGISWIGVCLAAALFGVLCGLVGKAGRETGEKGVSAALRHLCSAGQARIARWLHAVFVAMTAGVMLAGAGRLVMLALPLRDAFGMGVLLALGAACLVNLREDGALPLLGAAAFALCACFYGALWLDPRPAPIQMHYVTRPRLNGSAAATAALALLHGALNASAAAGTILHVTDGEARPVHFGAKCGFCMLVVLALANGAVLRGGLRLLSQALPMVILAARWGKAGYLLVIAAQGLCVFSALTAAVGTLRREAEAEPCLLAGAIPAGLCAFFAGL